MPKRRANGEGNIRKRKDGRWEGRYTVGRDSETGKAIIKNVLGKTQAEVKEKLKKAIEENVGIDYGRAKTYTVGSWLEVWMENYAKIKLRPSPTGGPTSPLTPNSKPPRRWAISSPVLSDGFRYLLPLGSAFGSEKSSTKKTELMKSKSPRNQKISRTFGTP